MAYTIRADVIRARNRHSALSQHYGPDDPVTIEAATDLRHTLASDQLRRVLEPLDPEVRTKVLYAALDALDMAGDVG